MPKTALRREISFDVSLAEMRIIKRIARRGHRLLKEHGVGRDRTAIEMDVCACHANGCRLDLEKLERADDFNLSHDLLGISRHLDHRTGELRHHFLPRCAVRDSQQSNA